MSSSRHVAGLSPTTGHHGDLAAERVDPQRPESPWLSDERIAEARRVWSKAYGRVISEAEAAEILNNVRRLADVLLRAEEERES